METVNEYRQAIQNLIQHYAQFKPSIGEVRVEAICDEKNDHYELMQSGWNGKYRIHGSVLHIDIVDGKVWIEHNGLSQSIAEELVQAGIPRDKIVLGFKHPSMRPFTDYAAG